MSVEADERDGAHRQFGGAAVADGHRHRQRLTGHDQAVVGNRFDAQRLRQDQRLLKLLFLLGEAEIDFIPAALVGDRSGKVRPQLADR